MYMYTHTHIYIFGFFSTNTKLLKLFSPNKQLCCWQNRHAAGVPYGWSSVFVRHKTDLHVQIKALQF